eukprot:COSAG03_NODE_516_length_7263_cov_69.317884_2_plen_144_part_00
MDELEPAMEDVGMGWSRVTEQDGAVYYWHEASEQSRWEPPPHSTPNGCGGARLGHRMCEGCGAKRCEHCEQACGQHTAARQGRAAVHRLRGGVLEQQEAADDAAGALGRQAAPCAAVSAVSSSVQCVQVCASVCNNSSLVSHC